MSYIIGAVTLPQEPQEVLPRFRKLSKEIPVYTMLPLIMNYGGRVPVLTLRGFLTGDTHQNLYDNYIDTLKGYIIGPAAFPAILLDESPTTDWTAFTTGRAGAYDVTLSNNTTGPVMGSHSLGITIGAGAAAVVGARRKFTSARKFENNDLVVWHCAGFGNTASWTLNFFDSSGNQKQYAWAHTASSFRRREIRLDEFTSASGTMDWDDVTRVDIRCTPSANGLVKIDRLIVGVGVLVDFPGDYDDGIYLVNDAQFPRRAQRGTRTIDYTMELLQFDEFYGVST